MTVLQSKSPLKIAFFLFFILAVVSSCRKGDDDPLLSLRTRKNRLCGEWKVSSETGFEKEQTGVSDGNPYHSHSFKSTTYSYDGNTKTGTFRHAGSYLLPDPWGHFTPIKYDDTTELTPESYQTSYLFDKDGTFQFNQVNDDQSTVHYEGEWRFVNKEELSEPSGIIKEESLSSQPGAGKLKNKEVLLLTVQSYLAKSADGTSTNEIPESFQTNNYYTIKELRHKKMVLEYLLDAQGSPDHGSVDYSYSFKKEITLTRP